MGTKVEAKSHFPSSMMDLNNGLCNNMWDVFHDDRTSGSEKSQFYDPFLMRQPMDIYPGYAKEQMRQTILKQESIFRHQLQELHRLYKRQRDLMNEVTVKERYNFGEPTEASKLGHFLSQIPSRVSKDPQTDSIFGRVSMSETNSLFSPLNHLNGFRPLNSKGSVSQRRVIDLELPADMDEDNDGKQNVHNLSTERAYNLADLNEPIQMEETSFSGPLSNKNECCVTEKLQKQGFNANLNPGFPYLSKISQQNFKGKEHLSYGFADGKANCNDIAYYDGVFSRQSNLSQADQNTAELQRKRTIFGVEICERKHTPSFDSSQSSNPQLDAINSWRKPSLSNHWLDSTDAPRQFPEVFSGNKRVNNSDSRLTNGVGFLSGINFKNSVSDNLEETRPTKRQNVMDVAVHNRHENPERRLPPPWLKADLSFCNEQTKGKETTPLYQMNLDSLQNHSQQFFKKAEAGKGEVTCGKTGGVTKILGVPIIDVPEKEDGKDNFISDLRHQIDLNLSFDEEEAAPPLPPCIPESVVKIATTEIDLAAPAVLKSETDPPECSKSPEDDNFKKIDDELDKVAAEAIMSISSFKLVAKQPPEAAPLLPADTLLRWFADVVTVEKDSINANNDEEFVPEGMDYFEYMTLNLQETEEYGCYKPTILEEKEDDGGGSWRKRAARKGQGKRGRQRKDFQRDVLPGIVSLSRREVTEDLQTFEEAFTGIGVSWQSSLSKRKSAAKSGRGRRRSTVRSPSPLPPPVAAVEQTVCREVVLEEKSLSGWGKRTRRLPRQRCQNGGNHHSLALKC